MKVIVFSSVSLLLGVVVVWLGGVTFLVLRTISHFNRLSRGVTDKTLSEVLTEQLKQEKLTKEELSKVLIEIENTKKEAKKSIQKIGIVRYNPFSDTGGDQSFSVVFLDGHDDGILLTSLFARTGVRWYIKPIRNGKGQEHELSKEEKEALKKALH